MRVIVTGLPHSGRRHFLAVLLLSLGERVWRRLRGPGRAELFYYRQRLLELGRCLPHSAPFVPFRLSLPGRPDRGRLELGGGARDLMARAGDSPPEVLVPALHGVDGVIHLVDATPLGDDLMTAAGGVGAAPPADPEVADALRQGDRVALERLGRLRGHDAVARPAEGALLQLAWALGILEGRPMGHHLSTPLALVFSKADQLEDGDAGRPGQRLEALLPTRFNTARVFRCSALGRAPQAGCCGSLDLPNQQVLAPLRWLLEVTP